MICDTIVDFVMKKKMFSIIVDVIILYTVTSTETPNLKIYLQQNLGGGSGLALGLKVSGCHGEFGKKIKKFAPGVEHCGSTANVKKRRSRHLYKGEYGKSTQNGCFCKFCPW